MLAVAEQKKLPGKYLVPGFLEEKTCDTRDEYCVLTCFNDGKKTDNCSKAKSVRNFLPTHSHSIYQQGKMCEGRVWLLKFTLSDRTRNCSLLQVRVPHHFTSQNFHVKSIYFNNWVGIAYSFSSYLYTATTPEFLLAICLPLTVHIRAQGSQKGQSRISVFTCYTRWVELCQTLQLFLAGNLCRICAGHQMAFSRKASTASVSGLSRSPRIRRYPCRRRCLVQQLASEIQEQQHTVWLKWHTATMWPEERPFPSSTAWRKSCSN